MSDGAKAGKPRKPEEDQVEDMAVDEDKTGNSGEEPQAQHLRVNTMEEAPLLTEFSGSGRTGRRNALPNILQQSVASIGTSAITEMLDQMTCAGGAGGAGGGAAGGGSTNGTERTHPDEQMGACGGGAEETHNQRLNHS